MSNHDMGYCREMLLCDRSALEENVCALHVLCLCCLALLCLDVQHVCKSWHVCACVIIYLESCQVLIWMQNPVD